MRKLFNFVFCLVILTIVASCNSRNKIGKEMKAFYGSHIELPIDSMINVSTKGQEAYYKNARYIYVMYVRSEEHTSELQSRQYLVCRLLLEKKNKKDRSAT